MEHLQSGQVSPDGTLNGFYGNGMIISIGFVFPFLATSTFVRV